MFFLKKPTCSDVMDDPVTGAKHMYPPGSTLPQLVGAGLEPRDSGAGGGRSNKYAKGYSL